MSATGLPSLREDMKGMRVPMGTLTSLIGAVAGCAPEVIEIPLPVGLLKNGCHVRLQLLVREQ